MADEFSGAGGPPPAKIHSPGGGGGKWPRFGFSEKVNGKDKQTGKPTTYDRRIFTWKLSVGERDRQILLLDAPGKENRFSLYLHEFVAPDGKFGSRLASIHRQDPLGDPLNEALGEEPGWAWALTGIDLQSYTNPEKPDVVYGFKRTLVLVRDRQKGEFLTMEKMGEGLRGRIFSVSRADDKQSAKIGTTWDPVERLTEEQMRERFAKDAEEYGLPLDRFLQPFAYKEMFKPFDRAKLLVIANEIKEWKKAKEGVQVATADDEAVPF